MPMAPASGLLPCLKYRQWILRRQQLKLHPDFAGFQTI
jgi:hypothetical protein